MIAVESPIRSPSSSSTGSVGWRPRVSHNAIGMCVPGTGARRRYATRRRELRAALGRALATRAQTLGGGQLGTDPERIATAIMALTIGLAQQALVDPRAVPGDLLGETIVLIYKGLSADAGAASTTT